MRCGRYVVAPYGWRVNVAVVVGVVGGGLLWLSLSLSLSSLSWSLSPPLFAAAVVVIIAVVVVCVVGVVVVVAVVVVAVVVVVAGVVLAVTSVVVVVVVAVVFGCRCGLCGWHVCMCGALAACHCLLVVVVLCC